MKCEPKFSIITVCYNAEKSIEKTIKSVLAQSFNDYEYIIIDGKSKDSTVSIAEKYSVLFQGRLTILSEEDAGIYDAMNKGIQKAKGTYLIFINADDELCEGVLAKVDEITRKNENYYDIIYGDSVNVYRTGSSVTEKIKKAIDSITLRSLNKGMGVVHQSIFTHRRVFTDVGSFNLEYTIGADWDFIIRCVKKQKSFYYINFPVSKFATDGISSKIHNRQRHLIRKNNGLYKHFDIFYLIDILNIKTMIQGIIGEENYVALRYLVNSKMVKK